MALQDQLNIFDYKKNKSDLELIEQMKKDASNHKRIQRALYETKEARYIKKRWKGFDWEDV